MGGSGNGAAGLVLALCAIAALAGIAAALSRPPERLTAGSIVACGLSCSTCARGNVVGCYKCGYCARFLPR